MLPCQLFCALKAGDFLMNWLYKEEKWEPWSCFPRAPCWLHWAVLTEILRVLRRVTSSLRGRTENGRASLRMYSIPALHPPSQVTPLILANPLGQAASVRTGQNFTSWLKEKKYICQAQWEGIKIGSWVAELRTGCLQFGKLPLAGVAPPALTRIAAASPPTPRCSNWQMN